MKLPDWIRTSNQVINLTRFNKIYMTFIFIKQITVAKNQKNKLPAHENSNDIQLFYYSVAIQLLVQMPNKKCRHD